jgi:transposase
MWTATTRAQNMRDGLRFASDLTDAEWAVLEPLLPALSTVGRPPAWPMRAIVDAIFYVLRGGIPWRMLPPCLPPRQTVYGCSPPGETRVCGRRSITDWSCWTASALAARPVPARP